MNTSRQENGETVSNRQVGYGLVFGVPKSLSIYLAITGDQVVEKIARSAVDETMRTMEVEMQCKVRKGGLDEDRRTGEMLSACFARLSLTGLSPASLLFLRKRSSQQHRKSQRDDMSTTSW
jgi:hypothetical protein